MERIVFRGKVSLFQRWGEFVSDGVRVGFRDWASCLQHLGRTRCLQRWDDLFSEAGRVGFGGRESL